jgi:DNA-binding PadR family transcriptional regulator
MLIVRLLSSSPKNGVELMDAIEKMTQGWWRPSPGSIYPVLEQLSEEGLIKKVKDGKYELTEAAQEEMESTFGPSYRKPRTLEGTIAEVSGFASYIEDLSRSDPKKVEPHLKKIGELADRLKAVAKGKSG